MSWPASEKQLAYMERLGIPIPEDCSSKTAKELIDSKLHDGRREPRQSSYGSMPQNASKTDYKPATDEKSKIMMLSYAKDMTIELIKKNSEAVTEGMITGYMEICARALKMGLRELDKQ